MDVDLLIQIKDQSSTACSSFPCVHYVRTMLPRTSTDMATAKATYTEWKMMDGRQICAMLLRTTGGAQHAMFPHFERYRTANTRVFGAKREYNTKRKRREAEAVKNGDTRMVKLDSAPVETLSIEVKSTERTLVIRKPRLGKRITALADVSKYGTNTHASAPRLNGSTRRKRRPAQSFIEQMMLDQTRVADVGRIHTTNVVCKCIIRGMRHTDVLSALMFAKVQSFPHCVIKVSNCHTISLYKSGQVHIAGRADVLTHLLALYQVLYQYISYTGDYVDVTDFAGVNFIGTFFAGGNLNLAKRREAYSKAGLACLYNPENFTGLHVYLGKHDDLVAVLHSTGMINVVGMRDELEVVKLNEEIVPSLLADKDDDEDAVPVSAAPMIDDDGGDDGDDDEAVLAEVEAVLANLVVE